MPWLDGSGTAAEPWEGSGAAMATREIIAGGPGPRPSFPTGAWLDLAGPALYSRGAVGERNKADPPVSPLRAPTGPDKLDTAWRVCWRRCAARPLAVVSPARRDLYARVHYRTSSRGFWVGRGIRVSRGGCLCGLWPDIRCRDRVLSIRSSQSVPWRLPSEAFLASHPACSTGAVACSSPAGWRLR